ncbi:MAG: hypothetical protein JWN23_3149 [Rhodocyclales bacterium]|nr:hypothetical protein [Rhodocyclales bacterium]
MSSGKPRLAFISPVFLFPNDAGGKIRTTNILRALKDHAFDITLLSPVMPGQEERWQVELAGVCDEFVGWQASTRSKALRAFDLLGSLPVNVAADKTSAALCCVREVLGSKHFDVAVFDFVHAAVLKPAALAISTVCFTHNVEAEIFARHAKTAGNPLMRCIWTSQHKKMLHFERQALSAFDAVVAVSERDAAYFERSYALPTVRTIPTGVDLDFFSWSKPPAVDTTTPPTVIFTGSMDWAANIDGVQFFLSAVWPSVIARRPDARFVVVGRHPPAALVEQGRRVANVSFTGFVDDVRVHVRQAHAFVIPLRVGGGTRIKAFEAMAMGCPVVSTAIGIEGLDVEDGHHYLCRDTASAIAASLLQLIDDAPLREKLSAQARHHVEQHFGHEVAGRAFERICLDALPTGSAA